MSIVERMARAIRFQLAPPVLTASWPEKENIAEDMKSERLARAALRSVKPEDVSDGMVHEFYRIDRERLPYEDWMERARRAIAAAIAAGAE